MATGVCIESLCIHACQPFCTCALHLCCAGAFGGFRCLGPTETWSAQHTEPRFPRIVIMNGVLNPAKRLHTVYSVNVFKTAAMATTAMLFNCRVRKNSSGYYIAVTATCNTLPTCDPSGQRGQVTGGLRSVSSSSSCCSKVGGGGRRRLCMYLCRRFSRCYAQH